MPDAPATFNVEVLSDGGARRLLSLTGVTAPPAVGDTMTLPDGHYQVLRRHWTVGPRSGPGGFANHDLPCTGTVDLYVRKITFAGPYGRRVGRRRSTESETP